MAFLLQIAVLDGIWAHFVHAPQSQVAKSMQT